MVNLTYFLFIFWKFSKSFRLIFHFTGIAGAIGRGGRGGGGETSNGRSFHVSFVEETQADASYSCRTIVKNEVNFGKNDGARNGIDNSTIAGMLKAQPPHILNQHAYTINKYKSFAREDSIGSSRQSHVNNFLNAIAENVPYVLMELIDELTTIENQYFHLRGKIDFIPVFESLLERTKTFAKRKPSATTNGQTVIEAKKVTAYLYTAILSKINGIKNKVYENTVFDLNSFLNIVNKTMDELRTSIAEVHRNDIRNEYYSKFDEKMRAAKEFIETQVTPEIDQIFNEIEADIEKLIRESIQKQNDVRDAIVDKLKRQKQLENNLILRNILAPIKVIAATASFLGPIGAAAGSAISGTTMLIDSFVLDETSASGADKFIPLISPDFKNSMSRISETLKQQPEFITRKISELDKFLKTKLSANEGRPNPLSDAETQDLQKKVAEYKDKELRIKMKKSHMI